MNICNTEKLIIPGFVKLFLDSWSNPWMVGKYAVWLCYEEGICTTRFVAGAPPLCRTLPMNYTSVYHAQVHG